MNLSNKVCLITGATSGIGKITAIEMAKKGVQLVLPVRNMHKGEDVKKEIIALTGNDKVDLFFCDFDKLQTVKDFAIAFKQKYSRLDILINNAGLWMTKFTKTDDGMETTWQVNHLAPFLLTNLLLDVIEQSAPARIVNLSSAAHQMGRIDFADLEGIKKFSWIKSYGQSKLANLLFTRHLAVLLKDKNVTVNCLHPGVVKTNLFDKMVPWFQSILNLFLITPEKGARTTIYLASSNEVKDITGEYFANCKKARTTKAGKDMAVAQQLWEVSLEFVKKYL